VLLRFWPLQGAVQATAAGLRLGEPRPAMTEVEAWLPIDAVHEDVIHTAHVGRGKRKATEGIALLQWPQRFQRVSGPTSPRRQPGDGRVFGGETLFRKS
jgi:hypothetical protein